MDRARRPPAERVRQRLRGLPGGDAASRALPAGYQRLGRVLLLRLPERLRPFYREIGAAWQAELGVETVAVRTGPVRGELREPQVEVIAGEGTETEVREHGIRWRFDASRIMFAEGNKAERLRVRRLVAPGESVVDLFAGIGYFAIPAASSGPRTRVIAVEKRPESYWYLLENLALNGVTDRVTAVLGDNREVPLPLGRADRVFLGYLPDAVPWLARAMDLVRPTGGWLHLHTVVNARRSKASVVAAATEAALHGAARSVDDAYVRRVKPYSPGRTHVVVDLRVVPGSGS